MVMPQSGAAIQRVRGGGQNPLSSTLEYTHSHKQVHTHAHALTNAHTHTHTLPVLTGEDSEQIMQTEGLCACLYWRACVMETEIRLIKNQGEIANCSMVLLGAN